MDHKPASRVSKRVITIDTDGHNGRTWQAGIILLETHSQGIHELTKLFHGGNESAENFRRVVGLFVHGSRGHTSQILQPSFDRSLPASVVTSVASSRDSTSPQRVIKGENQDLSPMTLWFRYLCRPATYDAVEPLKAVSTFVHMQFECKVIVPVTAPYSNYPICRCGFHPNDLGLS